MNEKENLSQTDTVENQTDSSSLNETAPLIEANNISENPESEASESPDSWSKPLSTKLETTDNPEQPSSELQEKPKNDNLSEESEEEPLDSLTCEWLKIDLAPFLTLVQSHDLYEQLRQYQHCRVQLCGEKVERVDTAALQLLLAFRNNPDITVGWIEPSAELCYAAQVVGLLSPLGLPCKEPPLFFQNH